MLTTILFTSLVLGVIGALLLILRSVQAFSQAGPQIREEVLRQYRGYSVAALARLAGWAALLIAWMTMLGQLPYAALRVAEGAAPSWYGAFLTGAGGAVVIVVLQFSHHLLHIPSSIMMSSHYKMSRFYWLWSKLSVTRLRWARVALLLWLVVPVIGSSGELAVQGRWTAAGLIALLALVGWIPYVYCSWPRFVRAPRRRGGTASPPNILMIGCDTLRVDRLGAAGYARAITPFLDALTKRGTTFLNCYTPLARTAPSLASLLTGTWPARHGVRDNFISDAEAQLPFSALPQLLGDAGYETVAISDWAGSDFGKLSLGFRHLDVPPDQWNLKYLIRQGPKDIRLFLSLFTHNRFGRRFLPEVYYLAGTPLTSHLGAASRRWISRFAQSDQPFFLNVFMATAHPPFGCEYPYYTTLSPCDYAGESKFAMARLVDPFDVIRSMREPREAFELDQIVDLYDSCTRRFDDEVRRTVQHLERCGLGDNTVIVIYSDHGMELFEHDTWGQGNSAVGEASPKVPLMIVDPLRAGVGVDKRVVRTVDLAPSVMELCGLKVPGFVQGTSLVPYLDDPQIDCKLPAYFETGIWLARPPGQCRGHLDYPEVLDLIEIPDRQRGTLAVKELYGRIVVAARDRMVRVGRWKLVRFPLVNGAVYQLFDLEQDPGCKQDVSQEHPAVADRLRDVLRFWLDADGLEDSGEISPGSEPEDDREIRSSNG